MFSISQCLSKRYQILDSILSNEDTMVIQKSKQSNSWSLDLWSLQSRDFEGWPCSSSLKYSLSHRPHLSLNSSFTILSLEEGMERVQSSYCTSIFSWAMLDAIGRALYWFTVGLGFEPSWLFTFSNIFPFPDLIFPSQFRSLLSRRLWLNVVFG